MHDMLRMMDVASALRRGREAAEAQLDLGEHKQQLRERLLATARASGESVTEAEVDTAIEHYLEHQHRYEDPPAGWGRFWAYAWVFRGRLLVGLAVLAVFVVGGVMLAQALSQMAEQPSLPPPQPHQEERVEDSAPTQPVRPARAGVPDVSPLDAARTRFERTAAAAKTLAFGEQARERVRSVTASGTAASQREDLDGLRKAQRGLEAVMRRLDEEYELRIVDRRGTKSGVDRYDRDGRLSGYYVFVEAWTDGRRLQRSIDNAETGRTERVTMWGEQVPTNVWQRLVADKKADGVLDEVLFARKRRGYLDEDIVLDDGSGSAVRRGRRITKW